MTEHSKNEEQGRYQSESEGGTPLDLGPTDSGSIGSGASGPRDLGKNDRGDTADADIDPSKAGQTEQTGTSGTGTQGSSNIAGQRDRGAAQHPESPERGQENIENYGSRRDDTSD
jgi:hypothetical protein